MATDTNTNQGSFLKRNLLALIVLIMLASIPVEWLLDNTTELWPDRSGIVMDIAFATGVVTAIAFFLLVIIIKPASRSNVVWTAAVFTLCGLILGTLLGMSVVNKVVQLIDFSGPELTRKISNFPIARAYKTYGKSACDHIQLRDYFGDFCINPEDYKARFLDKENTLSRGYCLRADTEQSGEAIRIMHSSSRAFTPGSVVNCQNMSR